MMVFLRQLLTLTPLLHLVLAQHQHPFLSPISPLNEDFAALANRTLEFWKIPGIALAVVDGEDVFSGGYGWAHVGNETHPPVPVMPNTLFCGGSTTKAFTAAAMSMLVDTGSLGWKTKVVDVLREDFVLQDEYATREITIEDILSHRTGMPRHDASYGGVHGDAGVDGEGDGAREVTRGLRWLPMTAKLREEYQYCNMMFVVASYVIEVLEGRWLGDILKERIWGPLGMSSTYFSNKDAFASANDFAQGYVYVPSTKSYKPVPYQNLASISGAGSIISNVLDYAKWLKVMMNEEGPISKEGHKELKKSRIVAVDTDKPFTGPLTYALAWERGVYRGEEWFGHTGGMEAFITELIFFPRLKYGLIAFGNTASNTIFAERTLTYKLIDDKLGVPESERFNYTQAGLDSSAKDQREYATAIQDLYPSVPNPPLPHSLPLTSYAGAYHHNAFHNMTIEISSSNTLYVNRTNAAWPTRYDFEHISGEFFIARIDSIHVKGRFQAVEPVDFVLGSDGKVERFGIVYNAMSGVNAKEGKIWFVKV